MSTVTAPEVARAMMASPEFTNEVFDEMNKAGYDIVNVLNKIDPMIIAEYAVCDCSVYVDNFIYETKRMTEICKNNTP